MVKKGKDLQTVDREIFSVIGQLFFLFHSSPTRENLWCSVALSFRDQSFAFDKVLLIKELCVYLSYVRKTLPQNNSVSCGQWCEWAFGQWMNYIPGKSFIRTRSLTSCQQPVCCGTLSNSKRGKQTHCCNVYFCPLPPVAGAENSTFSAKCGRRKFLQGTLFCKMHCVLHSFLAYMVFLWVVSRTDPGISLKYSRPAGNKTNDI